MKNFTIKLFATGLGSGYLKPFPGTWGTIPAWLIAWFLIKGDPTMLWIVAVLTTVLSIAISSLAEPLFGHDARKIVIDEWAGMFIALLFLPYSLQMYGAVFLAFRVFDVIKIWPARQVEKLPGGLGVTADDVVAGIQTILFSQLVIYLAEKFT
jgi:phosphatidylglycerophosphatase A